MQNHDQRRDSIQVMPGERGFYRLGAGVWPFARLSCERYSQCGIRHNRAGFGRSNVANLTWFRAGSSDIANGNDLIAKAMTAAGAVGTIAAEISA